MYQGGCHGCIMTHILRIRKTVTWRLFMNILKSSFYAVLSFRSELYALSLSGSQDILFSTQSFQKKPGFSRLSQSGSGIKHLS